MDKREYIIGIDIGSSNVVMAAGVRNDNGEISVLGVEVQETDGCVKDGDIVNYIELGNAISRAKTALENELGLRLNSAYIGISGRSVYCIRYEEYVEINEKSGCVTENEMRELHSRIEMVMPGGGDEIVDRIPLRYVIDDHQEVKNPIGAFGRKLSATYLFVLVGKQQIDRVNRALYRAEIKSCGLCVNPTILPRTILSREESEEGVVVVDLGSDLTDISIVREGKLWYFSSLPIGASAINNDLHDFLRTSKRDIEVVKRKYGSATADGVPENTTVPVKTAGHAKKQILQRNIAEIAEERLKDIAGFIARELKGAKFSTKVPCGVVLTGGSAYLSNMEQLFARELQMEVRLATMLNGLDDESQQRISAYPQSVVVGLLLYGAEHNACEIAPELIKPKGVESQMQQPINDTPTDIFNGGALEDLSEKSGNTDTIEVEDIEKIEENNVDDDIDKRDEKPSNDNIEKVTDDHKEPKQKEKKRSGWLNRFRDWMDDMFDDELI